MKYIPTNLVDTFKDKNPLCIMTFPPKFLASFKIKSIKPTQNRTIKSKCLSESFWLFVKESLSMFFSMTRPALQRFHLATLKLLASPSCFPEGKGLSRKTEESITNRLSHAFAAQTQNEKIKRDALSCT